MNLFFKKFTNSIEKEVPRESEAVPDEQAGSPNFNKVNRTCSEKTENNG